ncbi:hypothetical protein AB4Y45_32895 [Paraburkholderia sp. EG287A]|uniref:hypothetical protein n=1 Tax=Paraburkholderia sp. EG287A TaxID=3237012 RepID=UPI0034D374CE
MFNANDMAGLFPYKTPTLVVNSGDAAPALKRLQGSIDFADTNLKVSGNHLGDGLYFLRVILAENALVQHATCPTFLFHSHCDGIPIWDRLDELTNGISAESLREFALGLERRHPRNGESHRMRGDDGWEVLRWDTPAHRVFFAPTFAKVAPLDAVPKEWSMSHLLRAVAGGQCVEAYRFRNRVAEAVAPLALIEELMTMSKSVFEDLMWHWEAATRTLTSRHSGIVEHSSFTLNI